MGKEVDAMVAHYDPDHKPKAAQDAIIEFQNRSDDIWAGLARDLLETLGPKQWAAWSTLAAQN